VPCGRKKHTLRWEAGTLQLPSHPGTRLVLTTLDGENPACVKLAEAWGRHTDDMSVLSIWPRTADDHISVTWESVPNPQAAAHGRFSFASRSSGALLNTLQTGAPGTGHPVQATRAEREQRTAAPGAEPVPLDVHGRVGRRDNPVWRLRHSPLANGRT
jgi:hypothetical protein